MEEMQRVIDQWLISSCIQLSHFSYCSDYCPKSNVFVSLFPYLLGSFFNQLHLVQKKFQSTIH
jgi:hypothetical protein